MEPEIRCDVTGYPLCEVPDCDRHGWVVNHYGAKLTPPLHIVCRGHLNAELSAFEQRDGGPQ